MARLHIYTVHINPSLPQPYEDARFVEEGFNWRAFVFGGLWALYHRLWWHAIALFAFTALLAHLQNRHSLSETGATLIDIAVMIFVGLQGNDWVRASLRKRGYITADIVTGDSLVRGQQRFFDRYFAQNPAPTAA